jgi:hypothetical protein|tara:strand:+ start:356 stop:568 length:213 start_codon:yes stop_codon:yes gene_type:complete
VLISEIKKRYCFVKKEITVSDRFSITQGHNLLYVAWDDYDGEVIACNMNLDNLKQSIKDYVENAYHLEEE